LSIRDWTLVLSLSMFIPPVRDFGYRSGVGKGG
jgi:hypothetical protein